MMEMRDVKERPLRRGIQNAGAEDAAGDVVETDPMIADAPDDSDFSRGLRKGPTSWFTFVTDRFWPVVFLTVASLGLHEAGFVHEILYSPVANRVFIHLALAFMSLVVLVGSYVEVYRSMICGERVSYATARTSTHCMLAFMALSGICWTVGLWPVWHLLTLAYLFMAFWGVLVQVLVIFPAQVQRVVFAGGYLWFLYAYLGEFAVV